MLALDPALGRLGPTTARGSLGSRTSGGVESFLWACHDSIRPFRLDQFAVSQGRLKTPDPTSLSSPLTIKYTASLRGTRRRQPGPQSLTAAASLARTTDNRSTLRLACTCKVAGVLREGQVAQNISVSSFAVNDSAVAGARDLSFTLVATGSVDDVEAGFLIGGAQCQGHCGELTTVATDVKCTAYLQPGAVVTPYVKAPNGWSVSGSGYFEAPKLDSELVLPKWDGMFAAITGVVAVLAVIGIGVFLFYGLDELLDPGLKSEDYLVLLALSGTGLGAALTATGAWAYVVEMRSRRTDKDANLRGSTDPDLVRVVHSSRALWMITSGALLVAAMLFILRNGDASMGEDTHSIIDSVSASAFVL